MVAGTMSGVGKSLFTLALCRTFANLGYKTAPFKSQNMSSNSIICEDGREIALSQYIQALASRKTPTAEMNPVLLKPSVNGMQLILNGRLLKTESARNYMYSNKKELLKIVTESFEVLKAESDLIIAEGSGGCAEINLKKREINNITLAKVLNLPVVLVANIEKGGAFAQVTGVLELLSDSERELIKGFIFNKFHGDPKLLEDYPHKLARKYKIEFLGTIPYLSHNLPEEDMIFEKRGKDSQIKVDILKIPYMSNHFDFEPLFENFDVSYVTHIRSDCDLIIIPATTNIFESLRWIKSKKREILEALKNGSFLLGISEGYQMLGETVSQIDKEGKLVHQEEGLKLINFKTVLSPTRIAAWLNASDQIFGTTITGYELHHAVFESYNSISPFSKVTSRNNISCNFTEGLVMGRIFGTNLHNLFHNHQFTRLFFQLIAENRGKQLAEVKEYNLDLEIEKISNHFASHVDVQKIIQFVKG